MPQVIEQSLFLFQGGKERHSAHYRTPPHFLLFSPPCHCLPFEERRGLFISRIWRKINLPFLLLANYGAFPSRRRNFSFSFFRALLRSSSHISPWDTLAPRVAQFFLPVLWKVGAPPFPSTFEEFFLGTRAEERGGGEAFFFCCRRSLFSLCLQLRRRVLYARAPIFFSQGKVAGEKKGYFLFI